MKRIAFTQIGGENWTGGMNYQINLFKALIDYSKHESQPVLFLGMDVSAAALQRYQSLDGLEIIQDPVFDKTARSKRLFKAIITGLDHAAYSLFKKNKIDVVFESAEFFGWRLPIKAIAWIPDFQHRHLRQNFSHTAYWKREIGLRAQVLSKREIMLSSQDARTDCVKFYPASSGRTHVVHFSVPVQTTNIERSAILEKYDLPDSYLYLPNEFWRHKNHSAVISALSILKNSEVSPVIAVTGSTVNPSTRENCQNLAKRIEELGLETDFRVLGLVPYEDVQALMLGADAMLNPSHFEGWSTTVEEAKALGVKMLLSDIAVHREQAGDNADYFNPDVPEMLAEKIKQICLANEPKKHDDRITILRRSQSQMQRFADEFSNLVRAINN